MAFFNNLGIVTVSMLFGTLTDAAPDLEKSYDQVTSVSCCLALVALVLSILTHVYDVYRNNGVLSMNVEERNKFFKKD